MSDPMVQKIQSHPKYQELRSKRNRLGIFLTALMLIVYKCGRTSLRGQEPPPSPTS